MDLAKAPSFEVTFTSGSDDKRLDRLEKDVKKLTKAVDKLATKGGGGNVGVRNVVNKVKKVKTQNNLKNKIKDFSRTFADAYAEGSEEHEKGFEKFTDMLSNKPARDKAEREAKAEEAKIEKRRKKDRIRKRKSRRLAKQKAKADERLAKKQAKEEERQAKLKAKEAKKQAKEAEKARILAEKEFKRTHTIIGTPIIPSEEKLKKEMVKGPLAAYLHGGLQGVKNKLRVGLAPESTRKQRKKVNKKLQKAYNRYSKALISGDPKQFRLAQYEFSVLENTSGSYKHLVETYKELAEQDAEQALYLKEQENAQKMAIAAHNSVKRSEAKRRQQARQLAQKIKASLKNAKGADTAALALLGADDAANPQGWLARFTRGWSSFNRTMTKARTATQRLKTAGGWFVETALMSPERTVGKVVLNVMRGAGPYGFAVATAITMIISTPAVISAIVKVLGSKGGPLNRDWRRLIEDEVTGILSLEEQKRRDLGLDGYIVSPDVGFKPVDESSVYNSQLIRDEVRLNKLTQGEKVQFSR